MTAEGFLSSVVPKPAPRKDSLGPKVAVSLRRQHARPDRSLAARPLVPRPPHAHAPNHDHDRFHFPLGEPALGQVREAAASFPFFPHLLSPYFSFSLFQLFSFTVSDGLPSTFP